MTRPWWDGAVIYEVYPRAFADANGDGLGDLAGIRGRLAHLAADGGLGVDAIWLAPMYPHGGIDGGYDVTDFTAVAPEYGTLADLDRLLAACHRADLRVLLDLVAGHTSDRHPWFVAARAASTDPRRDWYLWADGRPGGGPPNNWVAEFGGSAWTADAATGQWYHHSFYPEQPDLNWRNPAVQAAMADVMRFWLDRGVDGFRVDAIQYLIKDHRLRDNPPARRIRPPWSAEPGGLRRRWSRDQRGVADVLRGMRQVAEAYPDAFLLGELYGPADRVAAAVGRDRQDGVHAGIAHQLAKSPWHAADFRRAIADAERHLPPPLVPTWAFSNHDLSRHATRWGVARARLAALILFSLRGTICLYQGEEIGMVDVPPGPWSTNDRAGRDPARAPFAWDEAARQGSDNGSLLAHYRSLIALRRESAALRHGTLRLLPGLPPGVLGYERASGREHLVVLANMGPATRRIRVPDELRKTPVAATTGEAPVVSGSQVVLDPDQGVILRVR